MTESAFRIAAFRSVERHPNREVRREIFKPMELTGPNEQKGTRLDDINAFAVVEMCATASDKVHFVARVRLLRILADRSVELNDK